MPENFVYGRSLLQVASIHTGPIIRKEEIYKDMSIVERRRI